MGFGVVDGDRGSHCVRAADEGAELELDVEFFAGGEDWGFGRGGGVGEDLANWSMDWGS